MATICIGTSWHNVIGEHFRALGAELARRNHRVLLLLDHQRKDLERHDINPYVLTWPSYRPTRAADLRWFARIVRQERPDALICNFGSTNAMLCVGTLLRVPYRIAWYHTLQRQIKIDAQTSAVREWAQRKRKGFVYRGATHFCTASEAARNDLARMFCIPLERITCLGYSLEDPGFTDLARANRLVCVGRLHFSKGQDILLRAAALAGGDSELLFVGSGPERANLERMSVSLGLAGRCTFLGAVQPSRVPSIMASAAVTIVPSRDEAFGLVNIESLAVGTPVIAAAVGGIPEIIRSGVDGLLFQSGDPVALAAAIKRLLTNPEERAMFGRNGRERFLQMYERSSAVNDQATWLEHLLAESRAELTRPSS